MSSKAIVAELEIIRKQNRGTLRPSDVVEFARDESTALHSRFVWDDSEAAEKYRQEQARHIIRASVTIIDNKKAPAYFSFHSERKQGNSYVAVVDILNDKEQTARMIEQAFKELQGWQSRYDQIAALRPVSRAISKAMKKKTTRQKAA